MVFFARNLDNARPAIFFIAFRLGYAKIPLTPPQAFNSELPHSPAAAAPLSSVHLAFERLALVANSQGMTQFSRISYVAVGLLCGVSSGWLMAQARGLEPHFFQSFGFYGVCGLGAIFLIVGLYKFRVRSLRESEAERLVELQTRDLRQERAQLLEQITFLPAIPGLDYCFICIRLQAIKRFLAQDCLWKNRQNIERLRLPPPRWKFQRIFKAR